MNKLAPLQPYGPETPLAGAGSPEITDRLDDLIRYALTVRERFGNTTICARLSWGANALGARDRLTREVDLLRRTMAAGGGLLTESAGATPAELARNLELEGGEVPS